MTVATVAARYDFVWAGSAAEAATGLRGLAVEHFAVIDLTAVPPETLTRGVHYTARLDAGSGLYLVTLVPAAMPAAPRTLRVDRNTPLTQATEFADYAPYSGAAHETLADAEALRDQEQRRDIDDAHGRFGDVLAEIADIEARALRADDPLALLPGPAERAGRTIVFDPLGQPRVVSYAASLAELAGAQVMAALQLTGLSVVPTVDYVQALGYAQPGDGGAGLWRSVGLAPLYATDIQSLDGRYWTPTATRRLEGLDARQFGCAPAIPDNKAALQAAIYSAAAQGAALVISDNLAASGPLLTASNLRMRWTQASLLRQTGFSGATGAFVTNVHPTDAAARVQENLHFENPRIDLSALDYTGNTTNSENALGFARGVTRLTLEGGLIKGARANFAAVGGIGGKGVGLDGGVVDALIEGVRIEGCYIGLWLRGRESIFSGTSIKERVSRARILGVHYDDCDVALGLQGRDETESPDADQDDMSVHVEGMTYHNCGFAPLFPAGGAFRWKAGVIVCGETGNADINGVQGYNDAGYIASKGGWPTTGAVIGQGLSGPIGAVIYGWGRNVSIRNVQHGGDVDAIWWIARGAAIGDDTAGGTTRVEMRQCQVENARVVGTVKYLVEQCDQRPVSASSAYLVGALRNASATTVTDALVGPFLDDFIGFQVDVEDETSYGSVRGTAKWVGQNFTNTIAGGQRDRAEAAQAGRFFSQSYTLADDTAIAITPPTADGFLAVSSNFSLSRGLFGFRVVTTGQMVLIGSAIANIATMNDTVLTGATGTDGNLTLSANQPDGKIYIENRRGASITLKLAFLC